MQLAETDMYVIPSETALSMSKMRGTSALWHSVSSTIYIKSKKFCHRQWRRWSSEIESEAFPIYTGEISF